jgi:hypothetical protein
LAHSASATFGRTPRKLWSVSTTPGPTDYNVEGPLINGLAVVLGKTDSSFCVVDAFAKQSKGCSSAFKSKNKRMTEFNNSNPGPGY